MTPTRTEAAAEPRHDFVPLVRTLLRAFRAAEGAAVESLRAAGLPVAGPAAWDLLRALPEDGIRASTLSRELGVTKQAVGQCLRDLEKAGLVQRRKDPTDRRALIVLATDQGTQAARAGERALREQEAEVADVLGRTRLRALRATLEELESHLSEA